MASVGELLWEAYRRPTLPAAGTYLARVEGASAALDAEEGDVRPPDSRGRPGGLIRLDPRLPTIVLPDLHGRTDFLASVLFRPLPGGVYILDALAGGALQILCLGDGFHAEARALERWKRAYEEYAAGYVRREAMDEEMRESLSLMEMVMLCKTAYPRHFHFLKGNHENVLNEEGNGNHPFRKFAAEGAMVTEYLSRFYGAEFLGRYAAFEKRLPLFAVGGRFLASHAEPLEPYSEAALIDARNDGGVILGLTWTDNGAARPGSVAELLERFHPEYPRSRYFTGHRTIRGAYRELSGGRHLQIHNPDRFNTAWIQPDRDFDPETDIGEIRSV